MTVKRPLSKAFLILSLFSILLLGFSSSGDQPDFPNIYVDAGCAGTHVGSAVNPYDDFADINWTTGGDNSVFDAVAANEDVVISLLEGDEWREQLTVGASGSAAHPIVITSYGTGADPIINGADLVETWTEYSSSATIDNALTTDSSGAVVDFWSRLIVPAATFAANGTEIRVQIRSHSSTGSVVMGCSVGERDGESEDYTDTPTRITFDTGNDGATLDADEDKWSDWVDYSWNISNNHLIHINLDDVAGTVYRKYKGGILGGNYYKSAQGDQTMTVDATSGASSGNCYSINQIELKSVSAVAWQATLTTEPTQVFFDGTVGNKQTALVDVNSANDWYWAANVLYIYYEEDPDGAVVVEASVRDYCVSLYHTALSYITVSGLNLKKANNSCFIVSTDDLLNSYIILDSCDISYAYNHGVALSGNNQHYCTISNNTIHDNRINGIYAGTTTLPGNGAGNHSIYGNTIEDNIYWSGEEPHGRGIYLEFLSDADIYSNIIKNNGGGSIKIMEQSDDNNIYYNLLIQTDAGLKGTIIYTELVGTGATGNEIYNNVMYCSQAGYLNIGHGIFIYTQSDANIHKNNIIYSVDPCVSVSDTQANYDGWNNVFDNNCYYRASGDEFKYTTSTETFAEWQAHGADYDPSGMATNPLMTDPANDNFHLNPHSPCVNAGTDVSLTEDYEGLKIRHAPDIGAHENQTNALFFAWNLFKQWWY